jgi:hypothetical protein
LIVNRRIAFGGADEDVLLLEFDPAPPQKVCSFGESGQAAEYAGDVKRGLHFAAAETKHLIAYVDFGAVPRGIRLDVGRHYSRAAGSTAVHPGHPVVRQHEAMQFTKVDSGRKNGRCCENQQ